MCNISTIIINYNTVDLLLGCLKSMVPPSEMSIQIIVVDNASEDASVSRLTTEFPWVKLIANDHNEGFARANNQALEVAKGSYIYFLNPDTVVRPGALEAMIRFMETHARVGLAGTRILNPDGSVQSSLERHYPGQRHAGQDLKGLPGEIAWVLGASMITRRDVIEDVGGFDPRFFLYGEEQDLCLRIRKAGWEIGFIPDALVVHWGGQSERHNLPIDVWKKKFAAELLFYGKHYSPRSVRRIHRSNVIQALWRVVSLALTIFFVRDKSGALKKQEKYRLALKTFHFWKGF